MAVQGNITSALTIADLNTKVNHEPRVEDRRLAAVLGFTEALTIRKLIKRHEQSLKKFGEVFATWTKPGAVGRPGKTYWLNKKQALFITAKSDTEISADVTIQMVEVFDEYLAGTLKPVKVKAHRRSMPKREAPRFQTPSEMVLDLLQAVRSAIYRSETQKLPFATTFSETLEDIIARQADPVAPTRGPCFDWNYSRASEDLYFKLKAQGKDVKYPVMARSVDPMAYTLKTEH